MKRFFISCMLMTFTVSCEILDDDPDRHAAGGVYVSPAEVAEVLSALPLGQDQMREVYSAVTASAVNGYDEEYTMSDLFVSPGSGVGDDRGQETRSAVKGVPLRDMIETHLKSALPVRSSCPIPDPDAWLDYVAKSDMQIYWPFSESWDGVSLPVITFDPEDDSDVNVGYRIVADQDGGHRVEQVLVDESMAEDVPVWIVNRNTDAGYTTLEMLRKEDPEWGTGGGGITVSPDTGTKSGRHFKSLMLKDFTMHRNYDSWFAGASEFFVKVGSVEDFTASTEAELKIFNPMVTDFLVVVRRGQKGVPVPFNALLVSEWTESLESVAFMIIEDDGGTVKDWNCTALVRVESKSYGVELKIPYRSSDDIVWRGSLTWKWFEANSNVVGHFGDVDLTFEVLEY